MNYYKKGQFSIFPSEQLRGLSPFQQVTMAWLIKHTNDEGHCFPSINLLCGETGIGRTKIIETLKELHGMELISKSQRSAEGIQTSNIYKVYTSMPFVLGGSPRERGGSPRERGGFATRPLTKSSELNTKNMSVGNENPKKEQNPTPKRKPNPKQPSEALALSKELLVTVSEATGRKLVSKPTGRHINKLLKVGVSVLEIQDTIKWIVGANRESEYPFCVQSEASLYEKWDKLRAAMLKSSETKPRANAKTGMCL